MRCVECGAEFDEMNESQPVCPGCGAVPEGRRDGADVCALLEDAAAIASAQSDREEDQDAGLDIDQPIDPSRIPVDFQEAADDAEGFSRLLVLPLLTCLKDFASSGCRPNA